MATKVEVTRSAAAGGTIVHAGGTAAGSADDSGTRPPSSHDDEWMNGCGASRSASRSASSRSHVGHPHSPAFMPHAQWCSSAPPSARINVEVAGPSRSGAATNAADTSTTTRCTNRRTRTPMWSLAATLLVIAAMQGDGKVASPEAHGPVHRLLEIAPVDDLAHGEHAVVHGEEHAVVDAGARRVDRTGLLEALDASPRVLA
jgi:hypothetical protein